MNIHPSHKSISRINYTLKYPDFKGRDSFAMLKVTLFNDGTRLGETLDDERIKSINEDWKTSDQSLIKRDELLALVKEIRAEYHHRQKIKEGRIRLIKYKDNLRILNEFISERIEDRPLVSPKAQIHDYTRAILHIDRENLSLRTASRKELQKGLNKIAENNVHRRICSRINSLLGFIGRRERLEPMEYNESPFIFSENEFLSIVENIQDSEKHIKHVEDIKNLFFTLYYTGLRLGEAFALVMRRQNDNKTGRKLNFLMGNKISVSSQMIKNTLKITKTKTGKERLAYVIQNHFARIEAWANTSSETKEKLRDIEFSVLIKKAAQRTFPQNCEMRRITAHDCRHSYAVFLMNAGVSISLIAKSLGNSVQVCEKYYIGYSLREDGIEMIHNYLASIPKAKVGEFDL